MIEIRIHGRGGQGAVLASRILAWAFFKRGKHVQSFPFFGVERRGAPVFAYTRVSDSPIKVRCMVEKPDVVVVLDPHLATEPSALAGLKSGGIAILNTEPSRTRTTCLNNAAHVFSVDGSTIAVEFNLGSPTSPIVNTVMVGAFGGATGMLSPEDLEFGIEKTLGKDRRNDILAMRKAFELVKKLEMGNETP